MVGWSIVLSVFSVVITIIISFIQFRIFSSTKNNLISVKSFFPEISDYSVGTSDNNDKTICTASDGEITSLMEELNQYIRCNKGTTDFSIIQNKTERRTNTVFEKAIARLSFPTYWGLIGTFSGVLIGLIGFLFFGEEDTRIDNLVQGVMVSMFTSLLGLWLTTRGNRLAAETKEILDNRKNQFYDFLQNSLMPSLGTSMVAALDRLRDTLGTFEPTFSSVLQRFESSFLTTIDIFKETFDSCTVYFGEEFRKNSELLNRGVDKMSHSVDKINANVDNQRQLLEEIRSTQMWDTLERFVDVAGILEESAKHIEGLRDVGKMIEEQVMALMTAQEEYTQSLAVPKVLTERINNLLDRVSTFERSINNLGPAISSSELIGTKELNDIKAHLDRIAQQNFLANRYADMQTERLEEFFASQEETIKQLNSRYRTLMEEHGEMLTKVMDESISSLEKKRSAFIRAIEDAFDVAEINTQFSYLGVLPELAKMLTSLEEQLSIEHKEVVEIAASVPSKEDVSPLNQIVDANKYLLEILQETKNSNEHLEIINDNVPHSQDSKNMLQLQNQFFGRVDSVITLNMKCLEQLKPLYEEVVEMKKTIDTLKSNDTNETIKIIKNDLQRLYKMTDSLFELFSKNSDQFFANKAEPNKKRRQRTKIEMTNEE